ncbi:MAG: hypothetical protein PHO42_01220 [Candidatus Omnitrophica bacterium]|nr:hypothetical protein [Candidatus Omnitrophota bacterium]
MTKYRSTAKQKRSTSLFDMVTIVELRSTCNCCEAPPECFKSKGEAEEEVPWPISK